MSTISSQWSIIVKKKSIQFHCAAELYFIILTTNTVFNPSRPGWITEPPLCAEQELRHGAIIRENLPSCSLGPLCWSGRSAQPLRVSHHPPQPQSEGRGRRPRAKKPGGTRPPTGPHTASCNTKQTKAWRHLAWMTCNNTISLWVLQR